MRALITACLILAAASTAAAGQGPVVVTVESGSTIRGRLVALTPERITLSRDGRLEQVPLDTVLRVIHPRDGVADGVLKGFLIGFLSLAIVSGDAEVALQGGLTYGLIGAGVDAMHGETVLLYDRNAGVQARARPTLGWTIRF